MQGSNGRFSYDETTEEFLSMRKKILFYEGVLLTSLAFNLTITHPYAAMLRATSLSWRGKDDFPTKVQRRAWLFINDSFVQPVNPSQHSTDAASPQIDHDSLFDAFATSNRCCVHITRLLATRNSHFNGSAVTGRRGACGDARGRRRVGIEGVLAQSSQSHAGRTER